MTLTERKRKIELEGKPLQLRQAVEIDFASAVRSGNFLALWIKPEEFEPIAQFYVATSWDSQDEEFTREQFDMRVEII